MVVVILQPLSVLMVAESHSLLQRRGEQTLAKGGARGSLKAMTKGNVPPNLDVIDESLYQVSETVRRYTNGTPSILGPLSR
jgi:hypothetical protein